LPVQIEQLDVLAAPLRGEDPAAKPGAPAQAAQASNPQLAHEIAVTVARLRSRELRLRVD
jgi:hypothetical protein